MATDLHIRDIATSGIITDIPPHGLPAGVWNIANNARFRDGAIERIGGSIQTFQSPDNPTDEPKGLTFFQNTWHWGSTNSIYQYQSGDTTPHQLRYTTPDDLSDSEIWTFTDFSGLIIANHPNTSPVWWDGLAGNATSYQILPDWGTEETWGAKVIKTYKNQLIALNMIEGPDTFRTRIRFSDIAQPGQVPAEWVTSTTNSAGFIDLSNATSEIIDGEVLGDTFYVYTRNEVFALDFIGGNEIYRVRTVFVDGGCLKQGCVITANNTHIVVTKDDIYSHNGSQKQSIISGRIKQGFFKQVKASEYVGAATYNPSIKLLDYHALSEVWVYFTTGVVGIDTRSYYTSAAVWNYSNNTWTYTSVPMVTDVALGGIPTSEPLKWNNSDTWGDHVFADEISIALTDPLTWDSTGPLLWDGGGKTIDDSVMIACGKNGFFGLDQGVSLTNSSNAQFILERQKLDLDEETQGKIPFSSYKTIIEVSPQFTGTGLVDFRFGFSETASESPKWGTPISFNIDTDTKIDLRSHGRYFSMRIEASDRGIWQFETFIIRISSHTQGR